VIAEDSFVDVLAAGCDAGIRYDDRLERDMIAVPIGPRVQRFATAAAPAYLDCRDRPEHPCELRGSYPARASANTRRRRGAGRTGRPAYTSFTASARMTPASAGATRRPVRSSSAPPRSTTRRFVGGR